MATHSSVLAWRIPGTGEPGGLQSTGSLRVGHDWATSLFAFMRWRRKWQPTPVFLPGEPQGRGSLVGCRLWGLTESDTTEATYQQQQCQWSGPSQAWCQVFAGGTQRDSTTRQTTFPLHLSITWSQGSMEFLSSHSCEHLRRPWFGLMWIFHAKCSCYKSLMAEVHSEPTNMAVSFTQWVWLWARDTRSLTSGSWPSSREDRHDSSP